MLPPSFKRVSSSGNVLLVSSFSSFSFPPHLLPSHFSEEIHDTREHDQQDTTARTQPEHLRQETLVEGGEAFLLHDGANGRPSPVVLGRLARDFGAVLDARLDDIHRRVENSTSRTTNRPGDQVVASLLCLVARLDGGELRADLEDTSEVSGVPEDVTPQCGFQAVVQRQGTLLLDDLLHHVQHAVVLARGCAVLKTDLDQFEGHDDEGFRGSGRGAGQDREGLRLFLHAEEVAVEGAPAIICGELGRTLRCFHEDGRGDTAV